MSPGHKIAYIRISSEDQNPARQFDGMEFDKIFTDKISGKSTDRPELQRMLGHVREGDHLFVHSMDRLARNLVDLRKHVKDLTDSGIKVTFIKENLTFAGDDSSISILLLSVLGAVAEFARSIIRDNQAEGIRIAKKKGVYKGRKVSFTDDQAAEMKAKVESGIPKAKVAREYKCSRETLYRYLKKEFPAEEES